MSFDLIVLEKMRSEADRVQRQDRSSWQDERDAAVARTGPRGCSLARYYRRLARLVRAAHIVPPPKKPIDQQPIALSKAIDVALPEAPKAQPPMAPPLVPNDKVIRLPLQD